MKYLSFILTVDMERLIMQMKKMRPIVPIAMGHTNQNQDSTIPHLPIGLAYLNCVVPAIKKTEKPTSILT